MNYTREKVVAAKGAKNVYSLTTGASDHISLLCCVSAVTSNRAAYSLSTVLFVCVLYVDASKLKFIFFVFFVCVLLMLPSRNSFFLFLMCVVVICKFKITSFYVYVCCCLSS